MSEELISKKELLEKYGISYGALYRWKRLGLIPEDWFLKKSVLTGQETFFPKEHVCERIDLILSRKDELSLSELAKELAGDVKPEGYLILSTVFGEKQFRWQDIRDVQLRVGEETVVLTEELKQRIERYTV